MQLDVLQVTLHSVESARLAQVTAKAVVIASLELVMMMAAMTAS